MNKFRIVFGAATLAALTFGANGQDSTCGGKNHYILGDPGGTTAQSGHHDPGLFPVQIASQSNCDADLNQCFSAGFWPTPLTINVGDSVLFSNAPNYNSDDGTFVIGLHNVVADDGSFRCAVGCDGEGGDGNPSAASWYFTRTFDTPGVVRYHDEATGAAGVITVLTLPCEEVAVEYYYADWNFYFVTAFPGEIAAIDGGAFGGGWKRTGESFNVWTDASSGALPTCRFLSTAFFPKSSHFYTDDATECASLEADRIWQYEGIAFYIQPPNEWGGCPATETIPLYRLYNNGMGGAPNHRYTTNEVLRNQMVAGGWVVEGNIDTPIFACVPR
jgi:hypothetical protein